MLTMFILFVMSLMAVALMSNTVTELQVSGNTIRGREAFTKADTMTNIGLLMGRVLLYESIGDPGDLVKSRPETVLASGRLPYNVVIDPSFTLANVQSLGLDSTEARIRERYLMATAANTPHLTIKYGPEVVGSAAVAIERVEINQPGKSVGQDPYGGDTSISVYILVSANGKVPLTGGLTGDYYTGDTESVHSVITSVFMETMN